MSEELSKHTLNLYAGDYDRLKELYPEVGAGAVIRRLVHNFIEKVDKEPKLPQIKTEVKL